MNFELKNGKIVNLEIGPLFLEYLDDYKGGIEALISDWKNKNNVMCVTNHFAYSLIASNCDEKLTYRDVLKLIKLNDLIEIANFIAKNFPDLEKYVNDQTLLKHF